jgi:CPA2 family monovalent cation:H+ antiporter-2
VGFGRVGRLVADMLARHQISYLAVDNDPEVVARERKAERPVYFGDASRPQFLRHCGIMQARVVAITIDSPKRAEEVAIAARKEMPNIRIIARARDDRHAIRLYEMGVTEAVPEAIEASLQLAESVLVEAGIPMGLAIAAIHQQRDDHRKLLGRPNRRAELAKLKRARDRMAKQTGDKD